MSDFDEFNLMLAMDKGNWLMFGILANNFSKLPPIFGVIRPRKLICTINTTTVSTGKEGMAI